MKFKRSIVIWISLLTLMTNGAKAQNNEEDSFQGFRKNVLGQYQGFRRSVLENYSQYLDGVWKDYKAFLGIQRDPIPKPRTAPYADNQPKLPVDIPISLEPDIQVPQEQPKEDIPSLSPIIPTTPQEETVIIPFYGMLWKAPLINIPFADLNVAETIGNKWKVLQDTKVDKIIPHLKHIVAVNGLNDWFCFQFAKEYVNTIAKQEEKNTRTILVHFILSNWGFDLRLAHIETGLCLLIPIHQQVYSRCFLEISNQRYYLFSVDGDEINAEQHVSTCVIPDGLECGNVMDFVCYKGINTSNCNVKKRTITDGHISVTTNVNVTLMEMVRNYPQMDIPAFAQSILMPDLRNDILEQIKPQISGLSQLNAANKLIRFVQYAFDYATDGEQHGYEKPYFLEENFYYPKNDCEDRAIFYAYLIHKLLNLDVHLVHFPGHECTAIHFTEDIKGDGYMYNGQNFIICDPTYIGATVGMCMDEYKSTEPEVEIWLK